MNRNNKLFDYEKIFYPFKKISRTNNPNAIFLIGTPDHGNLGDHAIVKAELNFFKDFFPEFEIIEITGDQFRIQTKGIKKIVKKEDTIVIHGGGFLGSLWMIGEEMARKAVQLFPNNRIIIFPQTCFYEDNPKAIMELQKTKDIYNRHSNLHICAREEKSYQFIREAIFTGRHSDCSLIPDIVTYLTAMTPKYSREGILLCLRRDKERKLAPDAIKNIEKYASKYTDKVTYTDTVVSKKVTANTRDLELEAKFKKFQSTRLVITDRLHGMIFAAITGTPCIAMDNISGKVKGVYEWLKHLNYLQYVNSVEDIPNHIKRLVEMEDCQYDNRCLQPYFQNLANIIRNS